MVFRRSLAVLSMYCLVLAGCGPSAAPPAQTGANPAGPPGGAAPGAPTGRPQGMGPGMMAPGGMGGPPGMGPVALPQFEDHPLALAEGKGEINGGNTSIGFVGTKTGGKHDGGFKTVTGTVEATPDGKGLARIAIEIETDSLWSDNGGLTNHLKNADFFDVKTHPKASFVTTEIAAAEGGEHTHTLTGDLTLHGVTKSISVPATVTLDEAGLLLKSTFKINRQDFGITFDASRVDNDVEISVAIGVSPK